ncbi:MAG TPA: hypothetical protein VF691_09960 [Cytophagaceae bacterium]|jgi:hypothetical protein
MIHSINRLVFIYTLFSGKNRELEIADYQGTYSGTFNRYSNSEDVVPTNVTLNLRAGKFWAKSQNEQAPGVCRGRYIISGDEIEFRNECMWISPSDPSLVLNGRYKLYKDKNNLQLKMTSDSEEDATIDFYNLLLQ